MKAEVHKNFQGSVQIGVLALQGGFALHKNHLTKLGVKALEVRTAEELHGCDGLIIPGGESTTLSLLLQKNNFQENLLAFAAQKPIWGTCAGLILMAKLQLLPIVIERNAYGRQSASFTTTLTLKTYDQTSLIDAVFIRAPQISQLNSPEVKVLASFQGQPVCVQYRHFLGCSFHPELTEDFTLHSFFINHLVRT